MMLAVSVFTEECVIMRWNHLILKCTIFRDCVAIFVHSLRDLNAASHVLHQCYALRADARLTDLARLSSKFHSSEGIKSFRTRVDAVAVVLPDVDLGINCTKPLKKVVTYGGYNKEDFPAVATKFWWQVATVTKKSWMDAGPDTGTIPDMVDCISGAIRNQVMRLGLRQSMPCLFKDLLMLDYSKSRADQPNITAGRLTLSG